MFDKTAFVEEYALALKKYGCMDQEHYDDTIANSKDIARMLQ
jgi:hypothetical protein